MNVNYEKIVKNIIETNYSVSTWGRKAKTPGRDRLKKQIDEVRHPKHYFETIFDHKEIRSFRGTFEGGVLVLDREINSFLQVKSCQ